MKTSFVTTLSIVGVLATGGAAFAANSTVLDFALTPVQGPPLLAEAIVPVTNRSIESTATGGAVVVVATTVLGPTVSTTPTATTVPFGDLTVGPTTSIVVPVTPTTTVAPSPGTTVAPSPGTTVAPAPVQFSYTIAGVGIITLKQSATSLSVVSVAPVPGWAFEIKDKFNSGQVRGTRIEVEFENGKKSVEFRAELLDGRVIAAVKIEDDDADEADDDADEDDADEDDEDDDDEDEDEDD